MLKVSVVVPVYNPGRDIDDCLRTLLDQSLPAEEYEVVFVDDGSTDGTGERLDALAAEHPHVRVEHIPNSGWPGRPRNVGLDMARGEYVLFVDNDDWVTHEALERLHATAVRDGADVVVGKVVGHGMGKRVPPALFQANRSNVGPDWNPLLWLLSPHKLFRRALLQEHGIRYPEGRRRLEDHLFVMHAYFHAAGRISVLADYPCYHWVLRGQATNASTRSLDPVGYYENLREVLDLIDEHTEPGELRDRLYARWYHGKVLRRMGGSLFLTWDEEHRRSRFDEARAVTVERFGPAIDRFVPLALLVRSRLLRDGDLDGLVRFARAEDELNAVPRVREVRWEGDVARLRVAVRLDGDVLAFERRGDRVLWVPADGLGEWSDDERDVTEQVANVRCAIFLRSIADRTDWVLPHEPAVEWVESGGAVRPEVTTELELSSARAAAGSPVAPGAYDLVCQVTLAGFRMPLRAVRGATGTDPFALQIGADGRLSPRRAPLRRRMVEAMPWMLPVVRVARRTRERARATR
jgi:glycosyltransferase involved in cell wall biosynthesis